MPSPELTFSRRAWLTLSAAWLAWPARGEGLSKDPALVEVASADGVALETPAHLLDDDITPRARHFVRGPKTPPVLAADAAITFGGDGLTRASAFTVTKLKKRLRERATPVLIECAANGRAEHELEGESAPRFTTGAVGCARWSGARLSDALKLAGVKKSARAVRWTAADGASAVVPLDPLVKKHAMLAWGMNGAPLPIEHGFPLRLLVPGCSAQRSGKWVTKLEVLEDNPAVDDELLLPPKSLITSIKSGSSIRAARLRVAGYAWSGRAPLKAVELSSDLGATWRRAQLERSQGRYAWRRFGAHLKFERAGYHEIWARAIDADGRGQPMAVPRHAQGLFNNAVHRVALDVQLPRGAR